MQVVSQYSSLLAPLAVDAVLSVRDLDRPDSVDLRDIKVLRKLGGTVSWIVKENQQIAFMFYMFDLTGSVYSISILI
jgi:chaperonin GroEL (HSP60 family)